MLLPSCLVMLVPSQSCQVSSSRCTMVCIVFGLGTRLSNYSYTNDYHLANTAELRTYHDKWQVQVSTTILSLSLQDRS